MPLAIDLFCGLGGWAEGFLAEGYEVVGFDIERHDYGSGGYPGWLVIQDVLTLHGSRFRGAAVIVASPPCQEFSYMAMPWSIAKRKALEYLDDVRDAKQLTALFDACFRIQREACEAAGHHIPLVVENVCGAQKWVGRARWHYGSFYLWGDVPALMPIIRKHAKVPGFRFDGNGGSYQTASVKVASESGRRTDVGKGARFTSRDCGVEHNTIANAAEGCKQNGSGAEWWRGEVGSKSSKSSARKAASAQIARVPLPLARYLAKVFRGSAARERIA